MKFDHDWFTSNIPNFQRAAAQTKIDSILEIGCYEGMSTCWMLQNIKPVDGITCIDTFEGEPTLPELSGDALYDRFLDNVREANVYDLPVLVYRSSSLDVLCKLVAKQEKFDLIYVDGSHKFKHVLMDAFLSWQLVKPGGFVIFDDYGGSTDVQSALKLFIDAHQNDGLTIVSTHYQMCVRKHDSRIV